MGPGTLVGFHAGGYPLTSGVLGRRSIRGDGLSVGLHGELLEVGRESVKVLVEAIIVSLHTRIF